MHKAREIATLLSKIPHDAEHNATLRGYFLVLMEAYAGNKKDAEITEESLVRALEREAKSKA